MGSRNINKNILYKNLFSIKEREEKKGRKEGRKEGRKVENISMKVSTMNQGISQRVI